MVVEWTGHYAGFIVNNRVFATNGRYLGWVDPHSNHVWKANGLYLGQRVEDHYILRQRNWTPPHRQTPPVPPVPADPPIPPAERLAKLPRPGWDDALVELLRMPSPGELVGIWGLNAERIEIRADGGFTWSLPTTDESTGCWELRGHWLFLRRRQEGVIEDSPPYHIIEFSGSELLLRWQAIDQRTFPFSLRRIVSSLKAPQCGTDKLIAGFLPTATLS